MLGPVFPRDQIITMLLPNSGNVMMISFSVIVNQWWPDMAHGMLSSSPRAEPIDRLYFGLCKMAACVVLLF